MLRMKTNDACEIYNYCPAHSAAVTEKISMWYFVLQQLLVVKMSLLSEKLDSKQLSHCHYTEKCSSDG